jgi:hypothetical protein
LLQPLSPAMPAMVAVLVWELSSAHAAALPNVKPRWMAG